MRTESRLLWGVLFTGAMDGDKPMFLYGSWHDVMRERGHYEGEPSRAVLFRTREAARSWCRYELNKYADRADLCRKWKFRPVRVVETIRISSTRSDK